MTLNSVVNKITELRKQLKSQEIDGLEFYLDKEFLLQQLANVDNKKKLFYELYLNDNKELSDDDKIVALTGITRYDIEKFGSQLKMRGISDLIDELKNFGNIIFNEIKEQIIELVGKVKDLLVAKVKEFVATLGEEFIKLVEEFGKELILSIIQQINNGGKLNTVCYMTSTKEIKLLDYIDEDEFKRFKKFSKEIRKLFEEKYEEVQSTIEGLIEKITDNDDNKKDEEKDDDKKEENKDDKTTKCCF